MFDKFTPGLRLLVANAGEEARRLGHGYMKPPHLLLMLVQDASESTAGVLAEAGITEAAIRTLLPATASPPVVVLQLLFTDDTKLVFRNAFYEALQAGKGEVDIPDILLGLVKLSEDTQTASQPDPTGLSSLVTNLGLIRRSIENARQKPS